jgi:hypothetical protein
MEIWKEAKFYIKVSYCAEFLSALIWVLYLGFIFPLRRHKDIDLIVTLEG